MVAQLGIEPMTTRFLVVALTTKLLGHDPARARPDERLFERLARLEDRRARLKAGNTSVRVHQVGGAWKRNYSTTKCHKYLVPWIWM